MSVDLKSPWIHSCAAKILTKWGDGPTSLLCDSFIYLFSCAVEMRGPDFTPTFTCVPAKLLSPLHTCCCCHVNEMHIFSRSAPLEWKGKYLHYAGGPECTTRPGIAWTRVYVQSNTVLTQISLQLRLKRHSECSQVRYVSVLMCVCLCINPFFSGLGPRLCTLCVECWMLIFFCSWCLWVFLTAIAVGFLSCFRAQHFSPVTHHERAQCSPCLSFHWSNPTERQGEFSLVHLSHAIVLLTLESSPKPS